MNNNTQVQGGNRKSSHHRARAQDTCVPVPLPKSAEAHRAERARSPGHPSWSWSPSESDPPARGPRAPPPTAVVARPVPNDPAGAPRGSRSARRATLGLALAAHLLLLHAASASAEHARGGEPAQAQRFSPGVFSFSVLGGLGVAAQCLPACLGWTLRGVKL